MNSVAPNRVVWLAAVLSLGCVALAVWLASEQNSLGLKLAPAERGVRVEQSFVNTDAVLAPGDLIVALRGPQGRLALRGQDLSHEPDMDMNEVTAYRAFLRRQGEIDAVLRAPGLHLEMADGGLLAWPVRDHRPLDELPWVFWSQMLVGGLGLFIGLAVWSFRQRDPATWCFAATGMFLMLAALSAGIYSTRELALPESLFNVLRMFNQFGTLMYTASFSALLWLYPRRLGRAPVAPVLFVVYGVIWIASAQHGLPSLDLALRLPVLAGFVLAIGFAVVQWRRAHRRPVERAALRWFLFSWFAGSGIFLLIVFVPALFGASTSASQGPSFILLLAVQLGLALGISRYRLFELDRWWYRSCLFALSGLLIVLFDVALSLMLRMQAGMALAVSVALMGWLYFPLRQWFWQKLVGSRAPHDLPAMMSTIVDGLSRVGGDAQPAWDRLLRDLFRPGELVELSAQGRADEIREDGVALNVVMPAPLRSRQMRYCEHGKRLFSRDDLRLLADLRRLFLEVVRYRNLVEEAVQAERDRVARDLHDDVGARLLTLSQRLPADAAHWARDALTELRAVVYSMQSGEQSLENLIADWRAETAERCEAAGVKLDWRAPAQLPDMRVDGGTALALSRMLRELVTNALRHGEAERVQLDLDLRGSRLQCRVGHLYQGPDPAHWQASLGLRNVRERAGRLGGEASWDWRDGWLCSRWGVDLAASA